jgi:hypothetical protein
MEYLIGFLLVWIYWMSEISVQIRSHIFKKKSFSVRVEHRKILSR